MRAIFLAIVTILTAVMVVPMDGRGIVGMFATMGPQAEAAELPAASGSAGWSRGETVLRRQANGHYYADVRIGGVNVPMMVDTGASFVALTADDADALGLWWDEDDAIVVAQGAGGPVKGIPVKLDEVEVGDHMVRNVRAAVIPEGLGVSLLGQSFLAGVGRVEISDGQMILSGRD